MLRLLLIILLFNSAHAYQFQSLKKQSTFIELFTSQGCSSCPPADKWISSQLKNDRLWKDLVIVSYHVDYWDYIGWKDIFATKKNSLRQRQYRSLGHSSSVYTPGFF